MLVFVIYFFKRLSELSVQSITGFILTRQAIDTRQGIVLNYWLKTADGAKQVTIHGENAVFFVETSISDQAVTLIEREGICLSKVKNLSLKTFSQSPVTALYFKLLRDYYRARECLKDHKIKCYEDDFRPEDRFLMERFVTGSAEFYLDYVVDQDAIHQHVVATKCRRVAKNQYAVTLSMVSLDIECSLQGELFSVGLYSHALKGQQVKTVFMIGDESTITSDKLKEDELTQVLDQVIWCRDEKHLLHSLIDWLNTYDPDVIIGWNVVQFDFNLLQKRCQLHHIEFAIGRDKRPPRWRKHRSSEQHFIDISGRIVLDGIDVLKTATYNFDSFSLENVSSELLGLHKKVDDADNRVKEILDNFTHDKLALAAYNLQDCRLVTLIFEKAQLLEFAILRSELTGLSLDRVGGSVAAFTNLYLPKLHRAGYIAPNLGDGMKGLVSPGGFVMESIPGLYNNVLVLDFKSLYPSIIRSFNIDPMGMVEGLRHKANAIEGFDGAFFSRDKHFLPDIINELWQERDKAKVDNNAALSQAIKIIMNSFYGVLGSTGCRFFDPRLSGSITKRGHELLNTTKDWIEQKGYQVIYGDTDSIFVHVGDDLSDVECHALGKALAQYINEKWQQTLYSRFSIESELELEFETHFLKFFMPTIRGADVGTKKRYAGLVHKNSQEQMVFKGLESVRTDWTQLAKNFQRALYHKVFAQEPVEDFIQQIVQQTRAGELDDQLVYRKRIRRKLEHYVKNVPPHIKAARLADEQNQKAGKPLKFQNRGTVEYYLTTAGPQAKGYVTAPLDYDLYVERQLKSVADAILPFIDTSFDKIVDVQMQLF